MLVLSLSSLLRPILSHTNPRSFRRTTNRCFTRVRECVNFSTFNASTPPSDAFSFGSFPHTTKLPSPLWRTHTIMLCSTEKKIPDIWKSTIRNRSTTTIVFFTLHIIKIFTHFSTYTHPLLAALQQHSTAAVFCQWPTNSSASQLFFNTRSVTRSPFLVPSPSFFSALDHEENR